MTRLPPPTLRARYDAVRAHSLALAAPLSAEDQCVQPMPDASPTKWHLAHTTWFFETLVLAPLLPGHRPHEPRWAPLFNSYYEALGPRHPRPQRGLLTRPALAEVHAWRAVVDAGVHRLLDLAQDDAALRERAEPLLALGLQHEQQHQELILTDILYTLAQNPLAPALRAGPPPDVAAAPEGWVAHPGGAVPIGHAGPGFAFDNETPRHEAHLQPVALGRRLVTNAEYQAFVDDGGYRRAALWLSDGWAAVQQHGWTGPLHWRDDGMAFGLHGLQPRAPQAPVCHLSFYEAAAYAEWAGARLPTEFEWEALAPELAQADDQAWQWTRSSYDPYPRYRPWAGAVGEYNGKFMVGQIVLRGGSCATPPGHARRSYRNFFPPAARWQFSGLRLAKDL
ncbi:ergothioneine biosynthesis protein EgtB [Piscinibacter sakaiensis]|uniref:Ergothioneine biosynthesis protein EgtB n=1 Tax=Piscinibacter sakaiensis TaxID=1547922 RepID=A0A0K8P1N2_PISS1|nr:ergothioneine biosynthesis protein EgtB [Piscinibacter sakaiensis]GAP36541.1 hypothetical protein ISF6_2381 [Piscinibacter sakaiensis]